MPPWMWARRARSAASSPRKAGEVDAEAPERLRGDAVIGLHEGGEQVLRVEHGALHPLGELLGGDDGLLGLLGESVELHGVGLCACVGVGLGVRWLVSGSGGGARVGLVDEVEEGLRRLARLALGHGRAARP